ncbi:50S ribosomal protein L31 [Patescibacteria group bacterium]|nr:50S ribosomal protein L31 [Patescibacteria group bacterium]
MKANTHPQYYLNAVVKCANCGHEFKTGATQESIQVEICSQCHPFFTGKSVLIDTEGRVDKFRKKMEEASGKKKKVRKKKTLEERVNEELSTQLDKETSKKEKKVKQVELEMPETEPETAAEETSTEEVSE